MTSRHVLPYCLPIFYAACPTPFYILDFSLDKAPNERFDVKRGFDLADPSSRFEELVRPPWSNTDVFLPNQSTRSDGRNGVLLQLDLLLQTQGHDSSIVRELDLLHPADLDPGDLNRRADTQASHAGEYRGQVIGATLSNLELAKTDREIRQGTQTQDDKQTNCDLEIEPLHGAFLMP